MDHESDTVMAVIAVLISTFSILQYWAVGSVDSAHAVNAVYAVLGSTFSRFNILRGRYSHRLLNILINTDNTESTVTEPGTWNLESGIDGHGSRIKDHGLPVFRS